MLPFLIYLDTLVYIPHYIIIATILYAVFKKRYFIKSDFSNYLFLSIVIIVVLSAVNFAGHYLQENDPKEIIPYTFLMLGSYLIAISLSDGDLKVLIYLAVVECFFGYLEFMLGVKTFFPGIENYLEVGGDTSLLYSRSVYGLSNNSSAFADKMFLAYLLTYWLALKGKRIVAIRLILLGGTLIAFNRTAMLAIAFFHGLQYASVLFKSFLQLLTWRVDKRLLYSLIIGLLATLGIIYLTIANLDAIVAQLTRKTQAVELSGRDIIWSKFTDFIGQHLFFGNGSFKYYVDYYGTLAHAHNSFLQVLATHGIFIFIIHILLVAFNVKKLNFLYVMPLLAFSITQYGIFWGISFMDIILMVFLWVRRNDASTNKFTSAI